MKRQRSIYESKHTVEGTRDDSGLEKIGGEPVPDKNKQGGFLRRFRRIK